MTVSDMEPAASATRHEATNELVQGKLGDEVIWVPPVKQWRASALHALRQGDMETWAEKTLLDDDWDIWQRVDPTIEQIEEFFASINPGLGTDPGNSRDFRRSSRTTKRR